VKKSVAFKWAKLLETTKRKQSTGYLKSKNGYCCLGILCVMLGVKFKTYDEVIYSVDDSWNEMGLLPSNIVKKVGMFDADGSLSSDEHLKLPENVQGSYSSLSEANDEGVSFKDIAKIIRLNYKEL